MLADYCNALWDTRVESDTVCSDGYEPSNLISRDAGEKTRGFLAERFVKPIVSILVSFPFPVDVSAVNLNPRVGGQEICGLELLCASLRQTNPQHKPASLISNSNVKNNGESFNSTSRERESIMSNGQEVSVFHSYEKILTVNNIKQEFNSYFSQVLRVRLTEQKVGHFLNPCFRGDESTKFDSRILHFSRGNIQSCNLQQGNRLRSTSHLWVRITQVRKGSVPCLGALEVVGKPAKNSDAFVINYAKFITLRLTEERVGQVASNEVVSVDKTNLSQTGADTESKDNLCEKFAVDEMPSEFIDPITFNIMTLPVLLPSGMTIDNSTLDKHIATERNWGRQASDPFTGVPLGSKIIPNAALKYRIDKFLLSADVKVNEFGRTVGSSSECLSTAKLKFDAISKGRQKKTRFASKRNATTTLGAQEVKKQHLANETRVVSLKPDSLDEALESVLGFGQKSFGNSSVNTSSLVASTSIRDQNESDSDYRENYENTSRDAVGCSHQEHIGVLFRLPCEHIVCRQCLTCAVQTTRCLYCQKCFEKKDVVRVHSKKQTFSVDGNLS